MHGVRAERSPQIPSLRVAPLGAVVTNKVPITTDFSFDPGSAQERKEGLLRTRKRKRYHDACAAMRHQALWPK